MSYCRWSSDDFQSDVYVYESCYGGYATHVAGIRYVFAEPLPSVLSYHDDPTAWFARHEAVSEMIEKAGRRPIGLPHDNETFNDETPGECADRLEKLRALGYNVPQFAIDTLREEAAEQQPADLGARGEN